MISGFKIFITILLIAGKSGWNFPDSTLIDSGQQPQITMDPKGVLHLAFGRDENIFYTKSTDNGLNFLPPQRIGEVKEMHLGMSRGPQLASSTDYSLISAMDKPGNIHVFRLSLRSGECIKVKSVNDEPGSAPEGLMSIAADRENNFYAVWLDIRNNHKNKIYFSSTYNLGESWTKNKLVYSSPEGTVCECCQPSITVKGSHVFIMFRNWLNGSRDLYLIQSDDRGESFGEPQKLGAGTWKINACPMDGGGLVVNRMGKIHTVWQRNSEIYYSTTGEAEMRIGSGRNCEITDAEILSLHGRMARN